MLVSLRTFTGTDGTKCAAHRLTRAMHTFETEFVLCDNSDYLPTASLYGLFIPCIVGMSVINRRFGFLRIQE
jgi:hypothetical protein